MSECVADERIESYRAPGSRYKIAAEFAECGECGGMLFDTLYGSRLDFGCDDDVDEAIWLLATFRRWLMPRPNQKPSEAVLVPRAVFDETVAALEKVYAGSITMKNGAHHEWMQKRIAALRAADGEVA